MHTHPPTPPQHFAAHLPGAIWAVDSDLVLTHAMGKGLALVGLDAATVIGRSLWDIFGTDDPSYEPIRSHLEAIDGHSYRYDREINGQLLHVQTGPLTNDAGDIVGCVGMGFISPDLALVNTSLRESEEKYRLLVEMESDALFLIDAETKRIVEVNAAAVMLYGYSKKELIELTNADLSAEPGKTRAAVDTKLKSVPVRYHKKKDGTVFPVEITGSYFTMNTRKMHIAAVRDISERQHDADALVQSRLHLKSILDNMPDMAWLKDENSRIIAANEAVARSCGMSTEELTGKTDFDIWPRELAEKYIADDQEVMNSGVPKIFVETFADVTRGLRWTETIKTPMFDSAGNAVGTTGIARDITDRKHAEDERNRLESHMLHSQKLESLGVLAGGIAHDFNNILVGILGNADLALMDLPPASPAVTLVQDIKTAAFRASDLAKQMLAYAGRGRFVMESVNINTVVNEMNTMLTVIISKKARLDLSLDPEVPRIKADKTQIRQVVMNLITNASEALDNETGSIAVSTGTVDADDALLTGPYIAESIPAGRYVYLNVTDTGSGMSEETKKKLFDPFYTTKFTGRGLGLSAVLGIVRTHHGAIHVMTDQKQGTTFLILFPAAGEKPEKTAPEAAMTDSPLTPSCRILVVDDEAIVRSVARSMLKKLGCEVETASDGLEAVETFKNRADEFDLVLLDISMPVMDGAETMLALHAIRADIPVILSSGYTRHHTASRPEFANSAGFLEKPFQATEMAELITKALKKASGQ